MKDNLRLLSTRVLDQALIDEAAYHHILIDLLPFIKIENQVSENIAKQIAALSSQPASVAFTSTNAIEIVAELLADNPTLLPWKIYCLGGASLMLANKYWPHANIASAAKNATELAQKIIEDGALELSFFCGNKRRDEMPALLREKGVSVHEIIVYDTIETPLKIDKAYHGILFFSPSAVKSFFSCNIPDAGTILFAIGDTTAAALKQFSDNKIVTTEFPESYKLVEKAIKHLTNNSVDKNQMNDGIEK